VQRRQWEGNLAYAQALDADFVSEEASGARNHIYDVRNTRSRAVACSYITLMRFRSPRRPSYSRDAVTIMTRPTAHPELNQLPLRGICLIVKAKHPNRSGLRLPPRTATVAKFPRRPASSTLSGSIPLFFIGRNRNGLWIARDAEGRTGGIFLLKRSALRFAQKNSGPSGCATMLLADRLELDVENHGNPLVVLLAAALRRMAGLVPGHPPQFQSCGEFSKENVHDRSQNKLNLPRGCSRGI
jgi:hypothetical protein